MWCLSGREPLRGEWSNCIRVALEFEFWGEKMRGESSVASSVVPLHGEAGRWLMCQPDFFEVSYSINPWMSLENRPCKVTARRQWLALKEALESHGAVVEFIPQAQGLPDMVFTANGGLVFENKVALPRFRYAERQNETAYFREWFISRSFEVFIPSQPFEGAGDAMFAGGCLLLGNGPRSAPQALDEVVEFLQPAESLYCEMIDPRFYHLDTCLAVLSDTELLLYPAAFSDKTLRCLASRFDLIEVSEQDACRFVCNSVVLDKVVLMPAPGERRSSLSGVLGDRGYQVEEFELSEFIKAGGAAKCLSLRIA